MPLCSSHVNQNGQPWTCVQPLSIKTDFVKHESETGFSNHLARQKILNLHFRTHGPLYEISRMKSSNIISLMKKKSTTFGKILPRRVPRFTSYWSTALKLDKLKENM